MKSPSSLHASIDTGDGEFDMNTLISNNAHTFYCAGPTLRYCASGTNRRKYANLNHYGIRTENARRPVIYRLRITPCFRGFMPNLRMIPLIRPCCFSQRYRTWSCRPVYLPLMTLNTDKSLKNKGYQTICIGGVLSLITARHGAFCRCFESWHPRFACTLKRVWITRSTYPEIMAERVGSQPVAMYINTTRFITNHFYVEGAAPARYLAPASMPSRYIDARIDGLLNIFRQTAAKRSLLSVPGSRYLLWRRRENASIVLIIRSLIPFPIGISLSCNINMNNNDIYRQYMYSYPHKTTYRELE